MIFSNKSEYLRAKDKSISSSKEFWFFHGSEIIFKNIYH